MKLVNLAILFIILLAAGSFAKGLEITDISARSEYSDSYTYQLEYKDRANFVSGLANNSKMNLDIFPGANVSFTVTFQNTLNRGGQKIRRAFAKITIESIDDGSDLEDISDKFELEPGDDTRAFIDFGVPFATNKGPYNVVVEAEGEDNNGTIYGSSENLKLEVKKLSHDLRVVKTSISPSIIYCSGKIKISAEAMNLGSNDENPVAIEFRSDALGIKSIDKDLSLDASEDQNDEARKYTKTMNVELPSSIKPGMYTVLVNLYWKNNILIDRKGMDLAIRDCGAANKNETITVITPQANQSPNAQDQPNDARYGSKILPAQKIPILNSPTLLIIAFGGLIITAIAGIIIFNYFRQ